MLIFNHAYPKISQSTFDFYEFVSQSKKLGHFINFWDLCSNINNINFHFKTISKMNKQKQKSINMFNEQDVRVYLKYIKIL